ncbi:MAG: ABC transporter permease subunit [Candidatus Nanopelagicales bacterium]
MRNVFTKWLWDHRRSITGWTIAILIAGCGYAAFWPTIDDPELQRFLESYPEALLKALNYTDIATASGYLNATVYGLIMALLLLVYAVSAGTRAIAGDEEAGTLDLVLAHPVSRATVALQRFAAFVTSVLIIVGVFWLGIMVISKPARLTSVPFEGFAAMHLHLAMFATLFGSLAFAVGAATGRRALALGVGAGVGVLSYAASGIIPQVKGLEWVKDYSPFTWLNGSRPLVDGVDPGHIGLMLGLIVAFLAIGTVAFQRRDVAA